MTNSWSITKVFGSLAIFLAAFGALLYNAMMVFEEPEPENVIILHPIQVTNVIEQVEPSELTKDIQYDDSALKINDVPNNLKKNEEVTTVDTTVSVSESITISPSLVQLNKIDSELLNFTKGNQTNMYVAFKKWKYPFPCYEAIGKGKSLKGLVYIKVPKTGSTTLAGVNLRIAYRHKPANNTKWKKCAALSEHTQAQKLRIRERNRKESFTWSVVREPTKRVLSSFYFYNRRETDPAFFSFANFRKYLKSTYKDKLLFKDTNYISTTKAEFKIPYHKHSKRNLKNWERRVMGILHQYDFLGISDRMDESLVVLRLLLGLDAGDILYLSSKVSGGFDFECRRIPKKVQWPELDDFIESKEWKEQIQYSNILYDAVNRSLDHTIDTVIGRDQFDEALTEHRRLLALAQERCITRTIFPCTTNGESQHSESQHHCYKKDFGCGYPCLDELYNNMTLT